MATLRPSFFDLHFFSFQNFGHDLSVFGPSSFRGQSSALCPSLVPDSFHVYHCFWITCQVFPAMDSMFFSVGSQDFKCSSKKWGIEAYWDAPMAKWAIEGKDWGQEVTLHLPKEEDDSFVAWPSRPRSGAHRIAVSPKGSASVPLGRGWCDAVFHGRLRVSLFSASTQLIPAASMPCSNGAGCLANCILPPAGTDQLRIELPVRDRFAHLVVPPVPPRSRPVVAPRWHQCTDRQRKQPCASIQADTGCTHRRAPVASSRVGPSISGWPPARRLHAGHGGRERHHPGWARMRGCQSAHHGVRPLRVSSSSRRGTFRCPIGL